MRRGCTALAFAAFAAALVAGALGCDAPRGGPDAGLDGARPGLDAHEGDDATGANEAGPAQCNGPAAEDLASIATPLESGTGLRYTGTNEGLSSRLGDALQPGAPACGFRAVAQRLFRYTMRTRGALRVSTNNPGTASSFDSVLFVTREPCMQPLALLGCNDDDPTAPIEPHVTASMLSTGVLSAGTTVLIALAGFYPAEGTGQPPNPGGVFGRFELTVRELPSIEVGEPCRVSDPTGVCVDGATCVAERLGATQGVCVRDGTVAGAPCMSAGRCAEGLSCDDEVGVCFRTVGEGALCERPIGFLASTQARARCAPGLSCVSGVRGSLMGTCAAVGRAQYAACASDATCDESLGFRCVNERCQRLVPAGAPCSFFDEACPRGSSCVASEPGGAAGVCARDGALGAGCREGAVECDAGLACILESETGARRCKTVGRTPGSRCGALGVCSYETPCVIVDASQPYEGVCASAGSPGGACGPTAQCGGDTVCVGSSGASRCLRTPRAGEPCDPSGAFTYCPDGTTCVASDASSAQGVCRATGSAAGAPCRAATEAQRCDTGLTCVGSGTTATCVRTARSGEPCDPRYATTRCSEGEGCLARALSSGVCAPRVGAPMAEAPASPALPGVRALPANALVRGAFERYGVDCYRLTGGRVGDAVFAQATGPEGRCTDDLALDVYARRDGGRSWRWLGGASGGGPFGCPRVDGREAQQRWAVLAAGPDGASDPEAIVCVRHEANRAVGAYELSATTASR